MGPGAGWHVFPHDTKMTGFILEPQSWSQQAGSSGPWAMPALPGPRSGPRTRQAPAGQRSWDEGGSAPSLEELLVLSTEASTQTASPRAGATPSNPPRAALASKRCWALRPGLCLEPVCVRGLQPNRRTGELQLGVRGKTFVPESLGCVTYKSHEKELGLR